MKTIQEVKALHSNFFSRGAMKFFNSKIESKLIGGRYFVTSEQFNEQAPRLFSIRAISEDGTKIATVGDGFQGYKTKSAALEGIEELLGGLI